MIGFILLSKNNWKDKKIVKVKHDGLDEKGVPVNPIVIEVEEINSSF